jgi:PAS domain S-box-containing protein
MKAIDPKARRDDGSHSRVLHGSCASEQRRCDGHAHNHFVQFYETDDFLAESVAAFFAVGLNSGEGCIVIATPAHQKAITQKLAAQGIDVARIEASGDFVVLDATETLSEFMVDDCPEPAKFESVIGRIIEQSAKNRSGVRAFGEMVALLWADRNRDAAIRLEELWNALGRKYPFSLLCGYPADGFSDAADAEGFAKICQAHSHVEPIQSFATAPDQRDQMRLIAELQQKALSLEREIARRSKAEEALRRREAELTEFVENASVGLHWVGPDGIIQWANKADFEPLGYTADEYIGHHIAKFHADQPVIEDILARLTRGERMRNYEARLKCKDNSIRTVLIDSCVLWRDGKFVHTQCFTRDITEQKQAQEGAARLAAIVEYSDDAIFSTDVDGIITSWNRGAERLYGYLPDEIIGRSLTVLVPEGRAIEEPGMIQRIRNGEFIENFETERRCKDGSLINVSLTVSPVKDAAGRIVGVSKVARDITEKVRAREILEKTVAERTASLREAVTQMEEFSYSVSHDLRAPLRAMSGYAEALAQDYGDKLDEIAHGYLEKIRRSSQRMDRLTQDVLIYSRVARAQMNLEPMHLEPLVKDVIHQYSHLQSPAAHIEISSPLLDVLGHETTFGQCIANLLSNAVKFVQPGAKPHVHIWTERVGNNVRVWFEDNGIGIKPEHQERIFQLFERIHEEGKYEGTGIGLSIVRKAVEKMGGKVGVVSDGQNGARFWIELREA